MKYITKLLLILFLFNNIYFAFGNTEITSSGSLEDISEEQAEIQLTNGDEQKKEITEFEDIIEDIEQNNDTFENNISKHEESFSGAIDEENTPKPSSFTGKFLIDVPNPVIEIQSGLEKGELNDTYLCKKEDCKINLSIEDVFTGDYNASNFMCEWDFGGGIWTTENTDKKCNPGYVKYSSGEYSIGIKIIDKNNFDNYKESYITITNKFEKNEEINGEELGEGEEEETHSGEILDSQISSGSGLSTTIFSTGVINTSTGTNLEIAVENTNSGSTNIVEDEKLEIPDIIFKVQSGIEQNGTGSIYSCKKEDCKVNLTVENLFTGSYDQSSFQCNWDFGSGTYSNGTNEKCNPGYIAYGTGVHEILLKISEKTQTGNFLTGSITVLNGIEYDFWITGSGEITHSSTGTIIDEIIYTDTLANSAGAVDILEDFSNDDISILTDLQQPSYVSGVGDKFHCDQSKKECKINFDFTILEKLKETDSYTCRITTNIHSKTLESCNPTTMIYTDSENFINIGVYDKETRNLVYEKNISIINNGYINPRTGLIANEIYENEISDLIETDKQEILVNSNETSIKNEENLINSNISILIDLQQPSYVNGVGDIFQCDRSKEECKINFNFLVLENLKETNQYICKITSSVDDGIFQSCNPSTKIFPKGDNNIRISVYEKKTSNLLYEKDIFIHNDGYQKKITQSNENNKNIKIVKQQKVEKKLKIKIGKIEIQSGLDENKSCKKSDCKINLKYNEEKGEKCEWNFPKGEYDEKTRLKCNPGYINYPKYGEYEIELKVYDKNYENNFKIQKFTFFNISDSAKKEEKLINRNKEISEEQIHYENFDTDFVIDLQGRASVNKVFSGSMIYCYIEPCNINLDGTDSQRSNGEKIELYWKLGENLYEGNNPKALWFNSGSYIINIQDGENIKNITLIVDKNAIKKAGIIEEQNEEVTNILNEVDIDKNIEIYLKISAISPNPRGVDNNEYIEIKNTGDFSINLRGVIIDDIIDGGSKPYIIDEPIILHAGEKMKLYKYDTKINLNNNIDTVNLSYDNVVIDSLSWNYNVADNYIITHQNSNIYSQRVKVIRVIDGDTIEVQLENGNKEKVRLVGVDTPEIYNTKNQLERQYGNIASAYTKKMILGKSLILELEESDSRDTYGRLLGYIYLENGENFNENLIRNGYSRTYLVYNFKYAKQFKAAESLAKKEKLIIWGNAEYKKIVNNSIKNDKILIAESKEYHNKITAKNFYEDTDNNSIPDSFQISIDNGEKIIYSTGSMKRYDNFIQNSFHINVSKLNAGVKISGKTIANAQITFKISDKNYSTTSDNSGEFILNVGANFQLGEYSINSYITDLYGNNFAIDTIKEFEISREYLKKLATIKKEKLEKEAKKRAKAWAKELKRREKIRIKAQGKIYSSIFIKQAEAYNNNSSKTNNTYENKNILTFLIIILSLFMFFFILKRKKLL